MMLFLYMLRENPYRNVVGLLISSCALLAQGMPTEPTTRGVDDAVAVLRSINVDVDPGLAVSGRATVVDSSDAKPITSQVVFSVLGELTKSSITYARDGPNDKTYLDTKWIGTPTKAYLYQPGAGAVLAISNPAASAYTNSVGRDFSLRSFQTAKGVYFRQWIDNLIDNTNNKRCTSDAERLANGTIHVTSRYPVSSSGMSAIVTIDIDPHCEMRVIGVTDDVRRSPDSWDHCDYKLVWSKFDDRWFPKEAQLNIDGHRPADEVPPGTRFKTNRHVKIDELEVSAKLSKTDFLPQALGVPPGARVIDNIQGVNYHFDMNNISERDLAEPLASSPLSRRVTSGDLPKTDVPSVEGAVGTHSARWSYLIASCFLIGIVTAVTAFLRTRATRRN